MAELILFNNDIQHFHSIGKIQRHSDGQLTDQVSVDDGILKATTESMGQGKVSSLECLDRRSSLCRDYLQSVRRLQI